jgi:serine/threonine protein kinase
MAPEIHQKQRYQGKNADLFAAAIILFVMVTQRSPFGTATPSDKFYKCLAANRADLFWKGHTNTGQFSDELKDLL